MEESNRLNNERCVGIFIAKSIAQDKEHKEERNTELGNGAGYWLRESSILNPSSYRGQICANKNPLFCRRDEGRERVPFSSAAPIWIFCARSAHKLGDWEIFADERECLKFQCVSLSLRLSLARSLSVSPVFQERTIILALKSPWKEEEREMEIKLSGRMVKLVGLISCFIVFLKAQLPTCRQLRHNRSRMWLPPNSVVEFATLMDGKRERERERERRKWVQQWK